MKSKKLDAEIETLLTEVEQLTDRLHDILEIAEEKQYHNLMMFAETSISYLKDESFYMLHELQKDLGYTDDATLLHNELESRFKDINDVLDAVIKKKSVDVAEYIYGQADTLAEHAGTTFYSVLEKDKTSKKKKNKSAIKNKKK